MLTLFRNLYVKLFFLLVLFPVVVIFILSFSKSSYLEFPPKELTFHWYRNVLNSTKWIDAITLSLRVALITSIISTAISLMLVLGINRLHERVKFAVLTILISPLVTPMIVIAISLFFWFSSLHINDSALGLILAHILISFPIAVWILYDSNESISGDLDKTALTLGDNKFMSFLKVRFPLLKYGILTSLIITFIVSFDEPVVALFIAGTQNVTLPKAMWDGIRYEIDSTLLAVSSLIVFFTFFLIGIVIILQRQKQKNE